MTQAAVYKTVQAKVHSATVATKTINGETRDMWDLRIIVDGLSQYNFPCSMPVEAAAIVKKDQIVPVVLRKGRIKKEEYDGTKDYHWFWEIEEWDTGKPVDSNAFSGASAGSRPAGPSQNNQGGAEPSGIFRTKEELRLTAAYTIAASMAGPMGYKDINDVTDAAEAIYTNLGAINEPTDAPASPPEGESAQPDAPFCHSHQVPYSGNSTATGKRFHYVDVHNDKYFCIEGQEEMVLVPPQQP